MSRKVNKMKIVIKYLITIVNSSIFFFSCSKSNNEITDRISTNYQFLNEKFYDSLTIVLKMNSKELDSLENIIFPRKGDFGPNGKKIYNRLELLRNQMPEIKIRRDSVFKLTSLDFKLKIYNNSLVDLQKVRKEKEILILKMRHDY